MDNPFLCHSTVPTAFTQHDKGPPWLWEASKHLLGSIHSAQCRLEQGSHHFQFVLL